MAGTKAGGVKAAATNRAKYGAEFYARIGQKGGQNGHTGGFAANRALARIAGAKGGRISKRGSSSGHSCHLFIISSASVRSLLFLSFIEPIFA